VRIRTFLAVIAALAVAVPAIAGAQPDQRRDQDKVTGGGQVIAEAGNGSLQAGDTLGFVATDDAGDTRGRFQAVRTSDTNDRERPTLIYHGVVTCLEVNANTAIFGGEGTDRVSGEEFNFTVIVEDNGPAFGQGSQGNDLVEFLRVENPCDDGDPEFPETALARGNVTVHSSG
jgi:hypothetical protein